ncbi:uncharacterized protein K02A2.6-like [Ornithodoros turicata]|uniref:uncharacterized protein K02A2.6-like n=1 Tax=Ornithodoros turicata TaxID=34597 RepID=UPI003139C626
MQTVIAYCRNGWPPSRRHLRQELQPYCDCHDELHFEQGLLCRGMRLVIPDKYRKYALDKLHVGHRGMTACKSRARESLYWPNMTQNIEQMVRECNTCQSFQRASSDEPLLKVPLPCLPWQKLGIDFFHVSGQTYLLVIDYFSKYVELQLMNTTPSQAVVKALKKIYARFGIPFDVATHNGPPFDSEAFAQFNKDRDVIHSTSSPCYPKSNGQVERCVQTVKNTLRKAVEDYQDVDLAIMNYRATPSNHLSAPSEMLMGRKIRTLVPTHPALLKPAYPTRNHCQGLRYRQACQTPRVVARRSPLPPLSKGQHVWVRSRRSWEKAVAMQVVPEPRSYVVRNEQGATMKRNRLHLRPGVTKPSEDRRADDIYDNSTTASASTGPEFTTVTASPSAPVRNRAPPEEPPSPVRGRTLPEEHSSSMGPPSSDSRVTRSGRHVVRPAYLLDYYTS